MFFLALASMAMMVGCASSRSGQVYGRSQALQEMRVYYGTILEVRPVQIEGTQSGVGAVAGGVAGGVLGSMVGGGRGHVVGGVLGALGGAAGGALAEEAVTKKKGVEITVEMDNGEIVSVVQEADDEYFVGDRIRLLRASDGTSRVRQ
ncbi:MAG: hypothetical protein EOL86_06715 [Deltaproteobacteria bacterium]|nr:hypothetical protein [Deltaproteobacteria bacterium]